MVQTKSLLALDVGAKRIGVALADAEVRFANPLRTLEHSEDVFTEIAALIDEHNVTTVVVGLPRGLDGQATAQTQTVEVFIDDLKQHIQVPIVWQDEALTSVKAEAELAARNKQGAYNKSDVDALAATYILEDYLNEHSKEQV
jgi:putative holliday junction resolvase